MLSCRGVGSPTRRAPLRGERSWRRATASQRLWFTDRLGILIIESLIKLEHWTVFEKKLFVNIRIGKISNKVVSVSACVIVVAVRYIVCSRACCLSDHMRSTCVWCVLITQFVWSCWFSCADPVCFDVCDWSDPIFWLLEHPLISWLKYR